MQIRFGGCTYNYHVRGYLNPLSKYSQQHHRNMEHLNKTSFSTKADMTAARGERKIQKYFLNRLITVSRCVAFNL